MKELNDCFCCEGVAVETPERIDNRPSLSEIRCRIGTYASFKRSMLARLSSEDYSALRSLQTREDNDFSIALLDGWAMLTDVLTFYNERIAQENYLRTAAERRSLVRLAQLIGYQPHPGLAAHTYLAFTVEDTPGAPEVVKIPAGTRAQSIPGQDELPQTFETEDGIEARAEWNAMRPRLTKPQNIGFGSTEVYLKGTDLRLRKGDYLLFVGRERTVEETSNRWDVRRIRTVDVSPEFDHTRVTWQEGLGSLVPRSAPAEDPKVYVLRQRAAFFGHNAPDWASMTTEFKEVYEQSHPYPERDPKIDWPDFEKIFEEIPRTNPYHIDLDAEYPFIEEQSWLALLSSKGYVELYGVMDAIIVSHTEFNVTSRTTRVSVDTNVNANEFKRRYTVVLAESVPFEIAEKPIDKLDKVFEIGLEHCVNGLRKGQPVVISGKTTLGKLQSELAILAEVPTSRERTLLTLTKRLNHRYERETVIINANVVRATHGETIEEVLGSGDASVETQRFKLKQGPLTYTGSDTSVNGVKSSLEVRVDGVRWHEEPYLYSRREGEHSYRTMSVEEGTASVEFGSQNRPASGQENITARYRKGIGRDGLVKRNAVSLLPVRPLGVKGVTNVVPGREAQDPERREEIQDNAPLTVLTLGRLVSLKDHEDFARAFGGIEKALATWTWDGERRGVFLTVAGTDGAAVASTFEDDLGIRLLAAMKRYSTPFVPLTIRSYRKVTFKVSATLIIDADFSTEQVLRDVRESLEATFAFDGRKLGYPMALSEVLAEMQQHIAVLAVDLDHFHRTSGRTSLASHLGAESPKPGVKGNGLVGAELLVIDPNGINLRARA